MSATNYLKGHVKHNVATGEVAVRTYFDETNPTLAPLAWLVATVGHGSRNTSTIEVDNWNDLYTPPAET